MGFSLLHWFNTPELSTSLYSLDHINSWLVFDYFIFYAVIARLVYGFYQEYNPQLVNKYVSSLTLKFRLSFYKNFNFYKVFKGGSSSRNITFNSFYFNKSNYLTLSLDAAFLLLIKNIYLGLADSLSTKAGYKLSNSNTVNHSKVTLGYKSNFYYGLTTLWSSFRFWVLTLAVGLFIFYYLMYLRLLSVHRVVFEWVLIVMFLYWLLSGFVFFVKKYQYNKFTSVIQRFWKRTYILFWLIESCVFLCFFYLTLNASEEPVYMYDQIKLHKSRLFSWRIFIFKLVSCVALLLITKKLMKSLKWGLFVQQSRTILFLTLLLVQIFWVEFYQFFHLVNFYNNLVWKFNMSENIWILDLENRRHRVANTYLAICLLAKFWHLVFIFVFWLFFVLRVGELKTVRIPLLAANHQNFIILYLMTFLYMYPWMKFLLRRFMSETYYWFFTNARDIGYRVFTGDLFMFYSKTLTHLINKLLISISNLFINFRGVNFFYFIEASGQTGWNHTNSLFIRDGIISSLNMVC